MFCFPFNAKKSHDYGTRQPTHAPINTYAKPHQQSTAMLFPLGDIPQPLENMQQLLRIPVPGVMHQNLLKTGISYTLT